MTLQCHCRSDQVGRWREQRADRRGAAAMSTKRRQPRRSGRRAATVSGDGRPDGSHRTAASALRGEHRPTAAAEQDRETCRPFLCIVRSFPEDGARLAARRWDKGKEGEREPGCVHPRLPWRCAGETGLISPCRPAITGVLRDHKRDEWRIWWASRGSGKRPWLGLSRRPVRDGPWRGVGLGVRARRHRIGRGSRYLVPFLYHHHGRLTAESCDTRCENVYTIDFILPVCGLLLLKRRELLAKCGHLLLRGRQLLSERGNLLD